MSQYWHFLVVSTAKTSNFSTELEIKVFKGPNYVATFIVTVAVSFAFSSNILRLLVVFIYKLNLAKSSTFVLEYTLYIIWIVSI